jgi:hypothetical protein
MKLALLVGILIAYKTERKHIVVKLVAIYTYMRDCDSVCRILLEASALRPGYGCFLVNMSLYSG